MKETYIHKQTLFRMAFCFFLCFPHFGHDIVSFMECFKVTLISFLACFLILIYLLFQGMTVLIIIPFLICERKHIACMERNASSKQLWGLILFFATHVFVCRIFPRDLFIIFSEVTIEKSMCEIPHNYKCHQSKSWTGSWGCSCEKTYMPAKHHGLYQTRFGTYFQIPFKGIWPWEGPMWPKQNLCPTTELTKNLQE